MSHGIKIGELAVRCGISRDTVRFYERVGLLPPARRTPSGHRVFDELAVERLEFIRQGQQLGLTLEDIRELLRIEHLPHDEARAQMAERLRGRIEAIDRQLSTLRMFRKRLVEKLELCESGVPAFSSGVSHG